LHDSPFEKISTGRTAANVTRTLDAVVGYLYSTSFANHDILRDRVEAFESDLRETSLELEPEGRSPRTLEAGWSFARR
jgi:hypothetical protein